MVMIVVCIRLRILPVASGQALNSRIQPLVGITSYVFPFWCQDVKSGLNASISKPELHLIIGSLY